MFQIHSVVISPSTDADFRTTASKFPNQLLASGWVQSGDSGQMNLGTVSVPAANAVAGYMIFETDDVDKPVITLKLIFGRTSSGRFYVIPEVGMNGSDGAGGLNTPYAAFNKTTIDSNSFLTPQNFYISTGPDWFVACFGNESTSNAAGRVYCLSLERLIGEEAGTEFEDACSIAMWGYSDIDQAVVTPENAFANINDGNTGSSFHMSAIKISGNPQAGNAGIGIAFPLGYRLHKPMINIAGFPAVAYNAADEVTVNRYGVPITYYLLPENWATNFPLGYSANAANLGIRI